MLSGKVLTVRNFVSFANTKQLDDEVMRADLVTNQTFAVVNALEKRANKSQRGMCRLSKSKKKTRHVNLKTSKQMHFDSQFIAMIEHPKVSFIPSNHLNLEALWLFTLPLFTVYMQKKRATGRNVKYFRFFLGQKKLFSQFNFHQNKTEQRNKSRALSSLFLCSFVFNIFFAYQNVINVLMTFVSFFVPGKTFYQTTDASDSVEN